MRISDWSSDVCFFRSFGGVERVRAQPLVCRDRRQEGHGFTAAGNEAPGKVVVGACLLGFGEKPIAESPGIRSPSGEHSVSVDTAQRLHVLVAGLASNGIGRERLASDAKLGA